MQRSTAGLDRHKLISARIAEDITQQTGRTVMYVARIIARSHAVPEGLAGIRDQHEIQEYVESVRSLTDSAFVVELWAAFVCRTRTNRGALDCTIRARTLLRWLVPVLFLKEAGV